jgi:type IV secretion system protein VirB6
MNWTVFNSIFDRVEQPLLDAVNGVSDALLAAVAGPLRAALVIYIALIGFMILAGKMTEPIRDTWGRFAKGAAIAGFLTAGTYNTYVRDFFLNGLPNDLNAAITGAAGTVNAAAFDHVWNKAFSGGLAVWKNLSWTDFGLQLLIALYWMAAAIATAFGFLVWMVSHIVLGLYVAVGPILLGTFLFPATRSLFERWIGSMLSMILLQVFIVSLLVVLTGAENALLANIATAGGGNPIAQIQVLFGAIILFVIAAVIVVQLPGASAAIAGGMHFHANSLARSTFGQAAAIGRRAAFGARQLAGSTGHTAQLRLTGRTSPPGPSMSSSTTGSRA